MSISDEALLKIVMEKFPEQSMDMILDQFAQAKKKLADIELKMNTSEAAIDITPEPIAIEAAPEEAPKKKRYTKRNLIVKPEEAITDDHVTCCICGRQMKNLTAKHLASHDIDMDTYKKLCGYAPDTKLISASLLMQLQENVLKAQQGREAKAKANADKNQPSMVD